MNFTKTTYITLKKLPSPELAASLGPVEVDPHIAELIAQQKTDGISRFEVTDDVRIGIRNWVDQESAQAWIDYVTSRLTAHGQLEVLVSATITDFTL